MGVDCVFHGCWYADEDDNDRWRRRLWNALETVVIVLAVAVVIYSSLPR